MSGVPRSIDLEEEEPWKILQGVSQGHDCLEPKIVAGPITCGTLFYSSFDTSALITYFCGATRVFVKKTHKNAKIGDKNIHAMPK